MAAVARYFLRKLDQPINESSVRSLKKAYLMEQTRNRRFEEDSTVGMLPKKRERPALLGANLHGQESSSVLKENQRGS